MVRGVKAPVEVKLHKVRRAEFNLLMLDYCDLEADGVRREGVNTIHADGAKWRAQGFAGNLWPWSFQFRQTDLGPIAWPPDRLAVRHALKTGGHKLAIEVSGNLKNMLGPHFHDRLPGIWSWRICPETTPPGKRYRFYPTGLDEPPQLRIAPLGGF